MTLKYLKLPKQNRICIILDKKRQIRGLNIKQYCQILLIYLSLNLLI